MNAWTHALLYDALFQFLMKTDALGWEHPTECSINPFTVIFFPAV
jgi:hypothetical protein